MERREKDPLLRLEFTLLAERLTKAVRKEFAGDHKRIAHALQVFEYAQEILRREGGDPRVVIAASLLHDIGIREAERKHGSAAPKYQEMEGPRISRCIMEDLALDDDTVEQVCRIVANHHSARDIDTLEFRIVWDADWLANLPDEFAGRGKAELKRIIDRVFKTPSGKLKALGAFLGQQAGKD